MLRIKHKCHLTYIRESWATGNLHCQGNENLLRQTEVPVPPVEIIDHGEGKINDKSGVMGKKSLLMWQWNGLIN